ncbi:beta strand repeat-containing protein [Rhizobium alvei]|uniref:Calcium-binding protein n=1 Tax=Rhizobium alvei TaxID=1132659 RepID=A0ABT8YH55_9HYPH|nr:calcium-binding protein [Rhizobium alvei]MDO6963015.1 calcium-binding protein [Rhizobium alvei]
MPIKNENNSLGMEMAKITGTKRSETLNGSNANDEIFGLEGNDTLSGLGGTDSLYGGLGDDIYVVDNIGDKVIEKANEGTDLVQASVSYTLANNVENLTLTGNKAINATGNSAANILIGNVGNNVLDGKAGADKMSGGKGNDTYIVDSAGDVVTEKAGEGTDLVKSSVSFTLSNNVENLTLTGTGAINATGNAGANILTGNNGLNYLDGKAGADTMAGGLGNDSYTVDNAGDVVVEATDGGMLDLVQSSISYTLAANVERLVLTGVKAINGTGNELNNALTGNDAGNTLDGGLGADTMVGGLGADTYVVDNAGDLVTEFSDEGLDTVKASVSYILGDHVENLTLTGVVDINGTGNALSNIITGNSGANILDGAAGLDSLMGGEGDDIYSLTDGDDAVTESSGFDTITSTINRNLNDYSGIEALTLLGSADINATANDSGNDLTGNSGSNSLTGGLGDDTLDGGAGADVMDGGDGDDVYYVDDASDVISEQFAFNGEDTVYSAISYTLAEELEHISLLGSADINATGNSGHNTIIGNSGNNVLNGGSDGVDRLTGGAGDDTYIVNGTSWLITEEVNGGIDTIIASAQSIGLTGSNVENATLAGSLDKNIFGSSGSNVLIANSGTNILIGYAGNDTMTGGGGNDEFRFLTFGGVEVSNFGHDTITDFTAGTGAGDVLRVGTQFDSFTGLVQDNRIVDDGQGNCTITFDVASNSSSTITLLGVTASQLVADDFLFQTF